MEAGLAPHAWPGAVPAPVGAKAEQDGSWGSQLGSCAECWGLEELGLPGSWPGTAPPQLSGFSGLSMQSEARSGLLLRPR